MDQPALDPRPGHRCLPLASGPVTTTREGDQYVTRHQRQCPCGRTVAMPVLDRITADDPE